MADFIEKVRSDGDILAEYEHWYAILDIKQYYLGRLFLYAKREGATDMVELNQVGVTTHTNPTVYASDPAHSQNLHRLTTLSLVQYMYLPQTLEPPVWHLLVTDWI